MSIEASTTSTPTTGLLSASGWSFFGSGSRLAFSPSFFASLAFACLGSSLRALISKCHDPRPELVGWIGSGSKVCMLAHEACDGLERHGYAGLTAWTRFQCSLGSASGAGLIPGEPTGTWRAASLQARAYCSSSPSGSGFPLQPPFVPPFSGAVDLCF